jgi:heat shock protein HslJ
MNRFPSPRSATINRLPSRTARTARIAFAVLLLFPLLAMPGTGLAEDDIATLRKQVEQQRAATGGKPVSTDRAEDPHLVLNRTWHWMGTTTPVEKITVPDSGRYTIRLTDDGKVQGRFDCNRGGGAYDISEGKLSIGPLLSTRMACPANSLDGRFMRDLQRVSLFFVQDGELYLELPFDSGTMRFRSQPQRRVIQGEFVVRFDPIEGGCWNLVAIDNVVYRPVNLDPHLRVNGLRVTASVRPLPDIAGFCPGAPSEIVEIVPLP